MVKVMDIIDDDDELNYESSSLYPSSPDYRNVITERLLGALGAAAGADEDDVIEEETSDFMDDDVDDVDVVSQTESEGAGGRVGQISIESLRFYDLSNPFLGRRRDHARH